MDLNESDCDVMKNYEQRLDQEWVHVLINLRMKYSHLFTRKRNSAADAWKNILQEMKELGAPDFVSLNKIKKKWMNLIARYKYLKFSTNSQTITWPFYEQLDRAYSRNPNIVELRKCDSKKGSDSDDTSISDYTTYMLKRQKFTSTLIQLRHTYRHLFTGKKFAAQKGWFVIQNLLPNGDNYTIEQISKCWQNLMQRYKNLLETEPDHSKITWVHFNSMHETMMKRSDCEMDATALVKAEMPSPKTEDAQEQQAEVPKKNILRLMLTNPPKGMFKNESESNVDSTEQKYACDSSNKVRIVEESENDKTVLLGSLGGKDKKLIVLKISGDNDSSKKLVKTENNGNENPAKRICSESEPKRLTLNPMLLQKNIDQCEQDNVVNNEEKENRWDVADVGKRGVTAEDVLAHLKKTDTQREEFHAEIKSSLDQIVRLLQK